MLTRLIASLCVLLSICLIACQESRSRRVLVLLTAAHKDDGLQTIREYCAENNITLDTSSFLNYITEDSLRNFDAMFLVGTPPRLLDYRQQNELERFVQAGGGLAVLGGYQDTILNWPWYALLAKERTKMDANPWRAHYDGGRVYFATMEPGSRKDRDHIISNALDFTINGKPDYALATTRQVPEDNRFVTEVLDTALYEPMEMVILRDGRVLYAERRGDVKLYHPVSNKIKTIATLRVSVTGNYEDGILGIALDPDYETNHWIYIYYSPANADYKQNISRFEMIDDSIVMASEKIVIEIAAQRGICCHAGGHLEFSPNGDLYIPTGHNASATDSDVVSNTHDLRGKILRIHPEVDGTYTIPDGNLFPKDGSKGRPEIYAMGTGSRVHTPAQKPLIWFPYSEFKGFPVMLAGSHRVVSGPVYERDDFQDAPSRFPEYFDGKLFIYEWARGWVKVVSFDKNVDGVRIEPFIPGYKWHRPSDMKFGPDGAMYVLQDGAGSAEHNPDGRLVRITYVEGNREPTASLFADRIVGAVPLTVVLSAENSFDFDRNDVLQYHWDTGVAGDERTGGKRIVVTYNKPGIFKPTVTVIDKGGQKATAQLEIRAGNEPPKISIDFNGSNRSFYSDRARINYAVSVEDAEDGSLGQGIDPSAVFFSFDYLKEPRDLQLLSSNEWMTGDVSTLHGRAAIADSDCKTCHSIAEKSIGPTYLQVAHHYRRKRRASTTLVNKIINGGKGTWGRTIMPAHPQLTKAEAAEMVKYILSLAHAPKTHVPLQGSFTLDAHLKTRTHGVYVVRANYTDNGTTATGTLTENQMLALRHPKVEAEDADYKVNVRTHHLDGTDITFLSNVSDGSGIGFKDIDLTGIRAIAFKATSRVAGSVIEIRTGAPNGLLLAKAEVPYSKNAYTPTKSTSVSIPPTDSQQDLYFLFRNTNGVKENILSLDWIFFGVEK